MIRDKSILSLKAYFDQLYLKIADVVNGTDVSMDFGTITTPSSALDVDFGSIV